MWLYSQYPSSSTFNEVVHKSTLQKLKSQNIRTETWVITHSNTLIRANSFSMTNKDDHWIM